MAKAASNEPITAEQMRAFAESNSDFAFELSLLPIIRSAGYSVEHGGTYTDPHSGKPRQFDFRAATHHVVGVGADRQLVFHASAAIECKNLRPNGPILLSCVTRSGAESFESVIVACSNMRADSLGIGGMSPASRGEVLTQSDCIYSPGDAVAKATDQVFNVGGELKSDDREFYEKWAQAVTSAHGLAELAESAWGWDGDLLVISSIYPVLVVPDNTLWICRYREGRLAEAPSQANHCSLYIDKAADVGGKMFPVSHRFSHLDVVTASGLRSFLEFIAPKQDSARARLLASRVSDWL